MTYWCGILACALFGSAALAADPRVVGYFTEWSIYEQNFQIGDIRADKLTHLNYAFARIVDGRCALVDRFAAVEKRFDLKTPEGVEFQGNFQQLLKIKKQNPHLKTLISVGGWTLSGPFSDVAATGQTRARFASSCVEFIKKYGFDGVDIDWEYPVSGGLRGNKHRPEDRSNCTLLLEELRKQLDAAGTGGQKTYLLTIAAPAGPGMIGNLELDKLHPHVDWINLMAYDFHGAWDERTNFNAPLYPVKTSPARKDQNVSAAVKTYLEAGVPPAKLVLGVPFTGRGWAGVDAANNGLFQPFKSIPRGSYEQGIFTYRDLERNYIGKLTRYWQPEAKAPWLFDAAKGLFISYDDPESIRVKAAFAREQKLGGVMCWELSADDMRSNLLKGIAAGLNAR